MNEFNMYFYPALFRPHLGYYVNFGAGAQVQSPIMVTGLKKELLREAVGVLGKRTVREITVELFKCFIIFNF